MHANKIDAESLNWAIDKKDVVTLSVMKLIENKIIYQMFLSLTYKHSHLVAILWRYVDEDKEVDIAWNVLRVIW